MIANASVQIVRKLVIGLPKVQGMSRKQENLAVAVRAVLYVQHQHIIGVRRDIMVHPRTGRSVVHRVQHLGHQLRELCNWHSVIFQREHIQTVLANMCLIAIAHIMAKIVVAAAVHLQRNK